ncbi:hypothetical protein ACLMJK_008044 [Lecanora helva]
MLDAVVDHPFLSIFLLFVAFPTVYFTISVFSERRAIARLGASPPQVRTWLPFGIDTVIRSMRFANNDTEIDFWYWLFSWSNEHSPTVESTLARERFIFTADPENIKAVLATQFDDFGKGEQFHQDWRHFLGDSIFTTDGSQWHASRQLIRPQFVKNRVADLEILEKHVNKMLGKIDGQGAEVDISALFYRYTLDSATDFLLGRSVDSLDHPEAPFASAFNEVQRIQYLISKSGPFNKLIPRKTFWAGLKVINAFVEPFIEQVLRMNKSDLSEKSSQSFLHALAATGTRDRKIIRDQIVAVLLAGRDTTAGALSCTFLELSAHPEIVRKLRREIVEKIGSRRAPTYEELKSMSYLQHVMNETLRLYPGVPFNVRMALRDTTLPTGGGPDGTEPLGILKNTNIGYSPLYMQRRTDLFPPESPDFPHVLTYAPERWEKWTPKAWTYIPFNGGPRICVGQQFALTEMAYTIVRILQRFEYISRYWEGEQKFKAEIVIKPANGVRVGFWNAEKA